MFSKNGFEKTCLLMIAKEVEFRSQHSKDKKLTSYLMKFVKNRTSIYFYTLNI